MIRKQLYLHAFTALIVALLLVGCSDEHKDLPNDGATSNGTTDGTTSDNDTGTQADTSPEDTSEATDSALADTEQADTEQADTEQADTAPDMPEEQPEHRREMQAAASGELMAGVGIAFLDGPVGISMAGYGARFGEDSVWSRQLKASRGFYSHLTIKAMVLQIDGQSVVMLKLPTMSSEHSFTDGVAALLKERDNIDIEGRLITGATHSHHAHARYWRLPESLGLIGIDSPDEEIIDLLITKFADAVKQAFDNLGPAEVGFGFQDDWDPDGEIYRDRRTENDPMYPKDPRLTMVAVRRPDGTPMATIINFGMHGTTFGGDNDLLTEDSAGGLEMKFEEHFYAQEGQPIMGMFIQSGGGDATPAGGQLQHPKPARNELLGEIAAPRVYALYNRLTWSRETSLAVRSRRIDLRYNWMGYDESDEFLDQRGEPYTWGALQCVGQGVEEGESMEGAAKLCLPLQSLLEPLDEPIPHGELHQTYLTVARIGDIFAVSLPGEPAYSVIKYMRDQIAERSTNERPLDVIGFGYSNDHLLYLTHPDDWYMGGYESLSGMWGPLFGKYIVDRQMQVVDDMLEGFNGPVFYEESPSNSKPATEFTPRGYEGSIEPGTVRENTLAAYTRTELVKFAFSGGDPTLNSPNIVLQADDGAGNFADVPSPSGWPGGYNNSRYHMLTIYTPDPPVSRDILPQRRHDWFVQWEIPEDFPAGTYRFHVEGQAWDGSQAQDWNADSTPFTIRQSSNADLGLSRDGDNLNIALTQAPVPYSEVEGTSWPQRGWRLLDHTRPPTERSRVRTALLVRFLANGTEIGDTISVEFNETASAHMLDMTQVALPQDAGITVRVWQANDRMPSPLEAPLP